MKNIILLSMIAFFVACQPQSSEEVPQDLQGLKTLLKMKQSELRALSNEVAMLEAEVMKRDTTLQPSKRLVTVAHVEKKDFNHYVTIQGNVESDDIVNASSEVGGRLTEVMVKEGQYVKRGQKIASVDLENLKKNIAEVEKSLELAEDVYERQARLWEQKIGSEIQYLQAKNNKERLEKSLETLNHQLTKGDVYAPISGAVDMVFLKSGEMAAPGAPIAQILNTRDLKIVADVPENLLGKVSRGDWVDVHMPALNEDRKARVSLIGRRIDPANRTFEIEMNISDGSGLIKPNLLTEIRINSLTEKDVIVVPVDIVQQEVGGKDYLMVKGTKGADFIAKKVYVTTGESYDGEVVITSGLTVEDQIIIDGARALANEELIEVATAENM